MILLLVRHAHAGDPARWKGDDHLRPLSKSGRECADALAGLLAPYRPERIISSPLVRCVQTVEALAALLGVEIELDEELAEGHGTQSEEVLGSILSSPDWGACVAVTHGDVIANFITHLQARGAALSPPEPRWAKGSTWVIRPNAVLPDAVEATYLPAPESPQSV
ncbi:MAG: phosphoglycerate mutase family protein [Actinomycetota bacterium]|nr:phosphoglycerate mutase family protein [Actinomycetota bacterium]